jgi:hypothetical protein
MMYTRWSDDGDPLAELCEFGAPQTAAQPRIQHPIYQIARFRSMKIEAEIEHRAKHRGTYRLADDAHKHV